MIILMMMMGIMRVIMGSLLLLLLLLSLRFETAEFQSQWLLPMRRWLRKVRRKRRRMNDDVHPAGEGLRVFFWRGSG